MHTYVYTYIHIYIQYIYMYIYIYNMRVCVCVCVCCLTGKTVTIVAPTENGQSGTYKEFDFDTTADDFFTHHPPK
jgi:hypothetical protein